MLARALACGLLLIGLGAVRTVAQRDASEHWVGAWAAADAWQPQSVAPARPGSSSTDRPPFARFSNQTLRQVVRTSLGGGRWRVTFSNVFGTTPLVVGAAGMALRNRDATIQVGSYRPLTFSGERAITIPPRSTSMSDPVDLSATALSDLAIDLFLPGDTASTTITTHPVALQTAYVSSPGNHAGRIVFPTQTRRMSWFLVNRLDVAQALDVSAIVVVGDSTTDGVGSTQNANRRWPDALARRLQSTDVRRRSVVNAALAGNRVLSVGPPHYGVGLLERFERDVLGVPGVSHVVVFEGINDIGMMRPGGLPSAAELIAAHQELIGRAHARRLTMIGATLTPFEGAGYFTADGERKRQAINAWIRSSKAYDAVIDFDAVTRDPQNPGRLLRAYDSGDHLHLNDAGYEVMGSAVDLALFRN